MNFDDLLLQILDEFIEDKRVDVDKYCKQYPEYKDAILAKFRTAEFIKKNLQETDLSGKKLGEYLILQELSRGGMGIVFLGVQPALSRLTAIKVLPPSFAQDKDALKNFQEEAKTIAKFNHPNIVPIYSISDENGTYYIAMGYISGLSLKSTMEILKNNKEPGNLMAAAIKELLQTPPAEKQAISQKSITLRRDPKFWDMSYFKFIATIGAEIASALSYAHQNGIIHGDLKPSNVLLTNEAIPMVLDFGLSRNIKELASSKKNEFSGTLAYASPEQIKENIINEKTDIWSLGVTLYELLTFKNPFVGKTIKKTADNILKGNPTPLRAYNKKIPMELEAIVLKCLEKNPNSRYASIEDLTKDLYNYLELKPISAKPCGTFKRIYKAALRKPVSALLILLLIPTIALASILGINRAIDHYFSKATILLNQNKTKEAFDIFEKLNKISKFYPYSKDTATESLIEIGQYSCNNQDYDRALKALELARVRNPKDFRILIGLGLCYHGKGLFEEAIKAYREGLIVYPENPELEKAIADVLYAQKVRVEDNQGLVEFCLKWSFSKNEVWGIQRALWSDYKQGGELSDALTTNKAIKNEADQKSIDILASSNAAGKLCQAGLYDEAIAIYTKTIESGQSNCSIYIDRGNAYGKGKKDYDKALADYNKAIELAPFSDVAYTGRALTYLYKGELDKALEDYNRSVELNARSPDAYFGRGCIMQKKRLLDNAINDYTKAIDLDSNNPAPHINRATAYYDKKDYKKAWDDVKEAQRLHGDVPAGFIEALHKASGVSLIKLFIYNLFHLPTYKQR